LLIEFHLTATECHLPYGITQCYLPPDTSEHTPPYPQPERPVFDLPTPEEWKAELTYRWLVTYRDGLPAHRQSPIQEV